MIDEKKIEEAARQHMIKEYCNNGDWSFPCKTADIKSQCEDDFKSGACWAMQEFLKDLWHPVSEEPSRYDDYLVITKQGCIDSCYFDADSWHDPKIGGGNVTMWLDYKDILPKQKGDKND